MLKVTKSHEFVGDTDKLPAKAAKTVRVIYSDGFSHYCVVCKMRGVIAFAAKGPDVWAVG